MLVLNLARTVLNFFRTYNKHLKQDQAKLELSIAVDLTDEFHWNTNQLFVYVTASYVGKRNVRNDVQLWDDIITSTEVKSFCLV